MKKTIKAIFPPIELCGDNAAMIAMVGLEKFKLKQFDNFDFPAKPRWPLDEKASFLKGSRSTTYNAILVNEIRA
jgi:N6-L-threonylcarbamoyladenine synthase